MSFAFFAGIVAFFYFTVWFCDSIFKSCMHYPYYAFLNGSGLSIGILHFTWTTTALNRVIFKWSQKASAFLQDWFNIGFKVTVYIFLPLSLWILFKTALFYFNDSKNEHLEDAAVLTAVIPGVNVPASELFSYIIALIVCSFIHELGHAMSAVQEDVQVISISILIALVFPIAFVKLNSDHLASIPIKNRLKVLSAGIWHNIILALLALGLVKITPLLFSIGYSTGDGVLVKELLINSPLKGERGLNVGDIVFSINKCDINSLSDWNKCLDNKENYDYGFCLSNDYISTYDSIVAHSYKENDLVDCCSKDEKSSLCFEYIEPEDGIPSLNQYSCLEPRHIIENNLPFCKRNQNYKCPQDLHCLKPILGNSTFLHILKRKERSPVVYIGHPIDIIRTIKVSQYIPKHNIFTNIITPDGFEQCLYYIMSISLGLAFLNSLPCFGFDGYHITYSLIQLYANKFNKSAEFANTLSICVIFAGTLITIPVLFAMFYTTFL